MIHHDPTTILFEGFKGSLTPAVPKTLLLGENLEPTMGRRATLSELSINVCRQNSAHRLPTVTSTAIHKENHHPTKGLTFRLHSHSLNQLLEASTFDLQVRRSTVNAPKKP